MWAEPLGVPTLKPPVDGRNAAPQTPLRMDGVCEAARARRVPRRFSETRQLGAAFTSLEILVESYLTMAILNEKLC